MGCCRRFRQSRFDPGKSQAQSKVLEPFAINPLPDTDELLALARRVVWFQPPETTLRDAPLFVAHLLTYSTPETIRTAKKFISDDSLRACLELAPPGVFDPRSWAYWNTVLGRVPVPPMPIRIIPDEPFLEARRKFDRSTVR